MSRSPQRSWRCVFFAWVGDHRLFLRPAVFERAQRVKMTGLPRSGPSVDHQPKHRHERSPGSSFAALPRFFVTLIPGSITRSQIAMVATAMGDWWSSITTTTNHRPYLIAPPPQNQTQCAIISTILYAHPRLPLFLAGRGDLSKETTLYSVVGSLVKPLHTFPASAADPSPIFRLEGRNLRLRLLDGSWVLLMQSNDGGMVVLESGTTGRGEPAPPETSLLKTPNGSDSADVVDVDMDETVAGKNDSYEAMLESVDSERRRRAANRASSLNVLDVVAPTEDVQTLPFHLAYAVLVERRGAMGLKGARRTCSMGRSLGTILVFVAWVGVRWLMIVPTMGQ